MFVNAAQHNAPPLPRYHDWSHLSALNTTRISTLPATDCRAAQQQLNYARTHNNNKKKEHKTKKNLILEHDVSKEERLLPILQSPVRAAPPGSNYLRSVRYNIIRTLFCGSKKRARARELAVRAARQHRPRLWSICRCLGKGGANWDWDACAPRRNASLMCGRESELTTRLYWGATGYILARARFYCGRTWCRCCWVLLFFFYF